MTRDMFGNETRWKRLLRACCIDCGYYIPEYYNVKDEVWAQTGLKPHEGQLHIACLERRIGRPLSFADINTPALINRNLRAFLRPRSVPPQEYLAKPDPWQNPQNQLPEPQETMAAPFAFEKPKP